MNGIRGYIDFYGEEKLVIFPFDLKIFLIKLGEMIGLSNDLHKINLSYSYKDKEQIFIRNEEDYKLFFEKSNGKSEKEILVNVTIKEEDDFIVNKNEAQKTLVEKNNGYNKEYPGDSIEENSNNNRDNSKNIINNGENYINSQEKRNNKNENIQFNQVQNNNNIYQQENISQNQYQNSFNCSNPFNAPQIKNQQNQYFQNLGIKNQQNEQINQNPIMSMNQMSNYSSTFDFPFCSKCKNKIKNIIFYYCKECNQFFCDKCETKIGYAHCHPFYKIRNEKQFNYFNFHLNNNINEIGNKKDGFGNNSRNDQ